MIKILQIIDSKHYVISNKDLNKIRPVRNSDYSWYSFLKGQFWFTTPKKLKVAMKSHFIQKG